jgi:hypothetical protein
LYNKVKTREIEIHEQESLCFRWWVADVSLR